jgi:hypothetical protein
MTASTLVSQAVTVNLRSSGTATGGPSFSDPVLDCSSIPPGSEVLETENIDQVVGG